MLFSQFLNNITLENPFSSIILGDSKCWWSLDKKGIECDSIFLISLTSGYTQLILSATYVTGNSSSFIDLIFTWQPNLVTSIGVHTFLCNNSLHQITFAPLLYTHHRLIWDYSNVDILNIRKSASSVNWSHLFSDIHIDIQVSIFEEWVLNVFKHFVPNNYIVSWWKKPCLDGPINTAINEGKRCIFF